MCTLSPTGTLFSRPAPHPYTNADGSVLILTNLQPGTNATIVHDGRGTSIPWSRYIAVAAW
jgi:hypothetical protein